MKGIVFTELMEMVESKFGADMVDDILDACDLKSGGAYTAVGTYDHKELLQIVAALSQISNISIKDLIHQYGHYLFFRFHDMMPQFFEKPDCAYSFLESVHDYIHVEVKKLYPDANLPKFETFRRNDDTLIMTYYSQCPFADFAHGLIKGCIAFYQENITIEEKDMNSDAEFCRVFTLTRQATP